jgi:hypothetical protein
MSGLRAWLGKEWRENRLLLGLWLLFSPLMVAVPGWLAGGQQGFRFPWEVGITIFVGLGLLLVLLGVGLFCVERRRDRLDWVRRTPRGLRNAYFAKMLLYLLSVSLAYVWMAFLAGTFAESLGAFTPKEGEAGLPAFLWLEYPHRELLVAGLGAGLWLVLASIVFGLGALNMALGTLLLVLFCLPVFWWSAKHPWFLAVYQPGVPGRLGWLLLMLGIGCGAWAWLSGTRHGNARKRVLALGLLPILIVFVVGTAYGFHALKKFESLDLSQPDVHIGLGTESNSIATISPNGRYVYAYLFRSNQRHLQAGQYPKPWPVEFAHRSVLGDPRPHDAFDVRATPPQPFRFDLQTGEATPMGELTDVFYIRRHFQFGKDIPRHLPLPRFLVGPGWSDTSHGLTSVVESDTGRTERWPQLDDWQGARARVEELARGVRRELARVRDEQGRLAWLNGKSIRFEDGTERALQVPLEHWRVDGIGSEEIPGGWSLQGGVQTVAVRDGVWRRTMESAAKLPRPHVFLSPTQWLHFEARQEGEWPLLYCDVERGLRRSPVGPPARGQLMGVRSRGRVGEVLRVWTQVDDSTELQSWRPETDDAATIDVPGLDLGAATPADHAAGNVVNLVSAQYDAAGNTLLQLQRLEQERGFAYAWLLLPAKAEAGVPLGGWRVNLEDPYLNLVTLQPDGGCVFIEFDPTGASRTAIVRYDKSGAREQLFPKP